MRTVSEHLDRVRERPHHVRRRIAFGTAGLLAGAIGLLWLGTSLATGAFAIQGAGFADATSGGIEVAPKGAPANQGLAGAAGAPSAGDTSATQVEVVPSSDAPIRSPSSGASSTIIPF